MLLRQLMIIFYVFTCTSVLEAQQETNVADSLTSVLSEKYLDKIDNKISALNKGIENKTLKMLQHLEKQERKIQKKLAKKDSIAAQQLFVIDNRYKSLSEQIKKPLNNTGLKEYIPEFNSLKTGLSFLDQSGSLTSKLPKEWGDKLKSVSSNVKDLENRFQQANDIKKLIKERRQQLKEQLEKVGLSKELKKINKEIFYYSQQLGEYRSILKDRKKKR